MSRSAKARRRAQPAPDADRIVTKASGPGDVAAMIPYLLGFHPADSLVVVALEGPRKRFGPVLRVDLADPSAAYDPVVQVMAVVARHHLKRVLLAAFSDSAARADRTVRRVLGSLGAHGVAVEEAFRADGRRWWSYLCTNPACCSPEGTPYDVGSSRMAAEAILAGLTTATDRDTLRELFAPGPEELRRKVALQVGVLRRTDSTLLPWAAAVEVLTRLPRLWELEDASPSDIAWLTLAVQSFLGQEMALRVVDRETAPKAFELWRSAMRLVGDDLLPAVGCLAAFCAWLDGHGVLASHALERVFAVAPRHPLARDLWSLLSHAVNPSVWDEQSRPGSGVRTSIAVLASGGTGR